jgi:hypothetical protein
VQLLKLYTIVGSDDTGIAAGFDKSALLQPAVTRVCVVVTRREEEEDDDN